MNLIEERWIEEMGVKIDGLHKELKIIKYFFFYLLRMMVVVCYLL